MSDETPMKRCAGCKQEFPATTEFFYRHIYTSGGLRSRCIECQKAYMREWRKNHPEKVREYKQKDHAAHHEKRISTMKRYYAKNRDAFVQRTKQWRQGNPEANRARRQIEIQRRLARKRALPNTLTLEEWQRALGYFDDRCAYCGRTADFWTIITMDHWIALNDQRPDNPGTVAGNIIPACLAKKGSPPGEPCCNNSKSNADPIQWLKRRFGERRAAEILKRIKTYFAWVKDQGGE